MTKSDKIFAAHQAMARAFDDYARAARTALGYRDHDKAGDGARFKAVEKRAAWRRASRAFEAARDAA